MNRDWFLLVNRLSLKCFLFEPFQSATVAHYGVMSRIFAIFALLLLGACAGPAPETPARIAVFGDSMMAWNGLNGASAPQTLARVLNEPVANFAVSGARMTHPLPISSLLGFDIRQQYRHGDWDVILVNGGANDFFFECGCGRCKRTLNRLISEDGQKGALPAFLRKLRDQGAQVIYTGYHRSRGLDGPAKGCRDELDALDARVQQLAEVEGGIGFVALNDVFPIGDPAYYAPDLLHPSHRGSAAIAQRLAPYVAEHLTSLPN